MRLSSLLTAALPLGLALMPFAASAHPPLQGPVVSGPKLPSVLPPEGEGRRLYLKYNCYGCHGMYGGGAMGPSLRGGGGGDNGGDAGDVREAVLQGEDEGMRSFKSYFSSTDIDNMVAYVRSLGTKSEPTFKDWWKPNPDK